MPCRGLEPFQNLCCAVASLLRGLCPRTPAGGTAVPPDPQSLAVPDRLGPPRGLCPPRLHGSAQAGRQSNIFRSSHGRPPLWLKNNGQNTFWFLLDSRFRGNDGERGILIFLRAAPNSVGLGGPPASQWGGGGQSPPILLVPFLFLPCRAQRKNTPGFFTSSCVRESATRHVRHCR